MTENLTLRDAITQHCNESMNLALLAERYPLKGNKGLVFEYLFTQQSNAPDGHEL